MGEIPPNNQASSPHPYFLLELSRLNEAFREKLTDFESGCNSFTKVHAAAYNVFCFLQDNQAWLPRQSEKIKPLLSPNNTRDETGIIEMYKSASDAIQGL